MSVIISSVTGKSTGCRSSLQAGHGRRLLSRYIAAVTFGLAMLVVPNCDRAQQDIAVTNPETSTVPDLVVLTDLPNFSTIVNVKERKRLFFDTLRPIVEEENERIAWQRRRLLSVMGQYRLNRFLPQSDLTWIYNLSDEYKVFGFAIDNESSWISLLARVDVIPAPLALVQAAIESAWGTSRLAKAGNNLFGQWCFSPGRGIVPADRDSGATHEVARFNSINASVRSYMRNLNTHSAYSSLRRIRRDQRQSDFGFDSTKLAQGLVHYSQRRGEYVREIQAMLRVNRKLLASV
jgi:Bax protein